MEEQKKGPAIADLSPDASLLKMRLAQSQVGEVIAYRELSDVIGQDVQNRRRSALRRAQAILQRERGFVFAAVKGEGLKRLSDDEIARLGPGIARRIHRAALRGVRRLSVVAFDGLSADAKCAHNAGMAALSFLSKASDSQQYRKVEEAVKAAQKTLPTAKMLELFR